MAIFNETQITTIDSGNLLDAWTEAGDARDNKKSMIIVNHEDLAPVLNFWQSLGLTVRHISAISAIASIICFSGACELVGISVKLDMEDYSSLAVPLAFTSITNLVLYCALWKTGFFYKSSTPAYLIDSFLKKVGTCNSLKVPHVSISNESKERHELVGHTFLSGTAFVLASVGRDKVNSVVDRFVEWGKNLFGGVKKLEEAATDESG